MRILLGCVAFLVLASLAPQGSFDQRARYGEPDVQRFAIRPDVTMAVEYGSDHRVCNFDIEPRHAFIHGTFIRHTTMSQETATELLNEVVPPEIRGKDKFPLFSGPWFQSSCGAGTVGVYENAQVTAALDACAKPSGVLSLTVRLTRPACEPLTK